MSCKIDFTIVLCGFMGCGKTTVGKKLSELLQIDFIDMDSFIEKKSGKSVSDIFKDFGEEYFRDLEFEASKELSLLRPAVISTGGGAFTRQRVIDVFRENNVKIIFLDTPLNLIKHRLNNDNSRPLLLIDDKNKKIDELYNKRYPLYKSAADMVIRSDHDVDEICTLILATLKGEKQT